MIHRPLSRKKAWALALVATFTMAISYVDRQTLAVLAPTVTAALDISETGYGWLASAFSLAYLVGAPLAGRLIDRVGAPRGLLVAVVVWSIVAGLHALAPGFGALFALRIALGLAESPSFPGAAQTVHRALPPEDRARGFGVLFTGSSIGAMLAPPLATYLEQRLGWRLAFLGTAVVGLAWIPVWAALAFSRDGRVVLETQAATAPERPSLLEVARHAAVLRALLVVLASAPAIAFVLLWGAKYLVREHALGQSEVGAFLWAPPLCFDVGSLAFGDLASRRARARTDPSAPDRLLLGVAAALAASVAALPLSAGPASAIAIAGVSMAGGGGLFALLTSDMLSRVPPAAVSTAGGITAAAQSLAYIAANPLIGRSVERTGGYTAAVIALGLWVLPGCVAWMLLRPPPVHAPERQPEVA